MFLLCPFFKKIATRGASVNVFCLSLPPHLGYSRSLYVSASLQSNCKPNRGRGGGGILANLGIKGVGGGGESSRSSNSFVSSLIFIPEYANPPFLLYLRRYRSLLPLHLRHHLLRRVGGEAKTIFRLINDDICLSVSKFKKKYY